MDTEVEHLRHQLAEAEQALARERKDREFVQRIAYTLELEDLLAILCEEIDAHGKFDGIFVNLIDETEQNLVCCKIRLPQEFIHMEKIYQKFRFPTNANDANAQSFRQKTPVYLEAQNLALAEENDRLRFERWKMKSLVAIPIGDPVSSADHSPVGTVLLYRQHRAIPPEVIRAIENRLSIMGKPIRNALFFHFARERERDVQMAIEEEQRFLQFVSKTNALKSVEDIYSSISTEFLRRFSFDLAGVFAQEGDCLILKGFSILGDKYKEIAASLEEYLRLNPYRLELSEGASVLALQRNQHFFFRDVAEILHLPMAVKDRHALRLMKTPRSMMIMPIRQADQPVGLIWLINLRHPARLYESQIKLIELLSSFIGSAIANAEIYSLAQAQKSEIENLNLSLNQRVQELDVFAAHDHLTGLNNFGFFEQELNRRIHEYRRATNNDKLSLVIFDVDRFKLFNDTWGHIAGNTVLREIALLVSALARKMDIVCRFGGEEFAVVLPKCGLDSAYKFAERLRQKVEKHRFYIGQEHTKVTVSAGCAEFDSTDDFASLVNRSDQALYQAKNSGRNRVEIASLATD